MWFNSRLQNNFWISLETREILWDSPKLLFVEPNKLGCIILCLGIGVRFWRDSWCEDQLHLFENSTNREASVEDVLLRYRVREGRRWDALFQRGFNDWEVGLVGFFLGWLESYTPHHEDGGDWRKTVILTSARFIMLWGDLFLSFSLGQKFGHEGHMLGLLLCLDNCVGEYSYRW